MTIEADGPAMRSIERELRLEFPSVPTDQVTILVQCLWSHFDGASVRDFVPLLVRRQAREELLDHLGSRTAVTLSPAGPPSSSDEQGEEAVVIVDPAASLTTLVVAPTAT